MRLLRRGRYIYVLNEVSSSLTVHEIPPKDGQSRPIQRFSIIPPDTDSKDMTAAEIILLPPIDNSPALILCTNRYSTDPRGDTIAVFEVLQDGRVNPAPIPHIYGIGKQVRALSSDPSGRYIITAGRDEGGVVVLKRNKSEFEEVARLDLPKVVVPLWIHTV
jgi:6-phosphogluconolactonase (cycloisomerase 2 family)